MSLPVAVPPHILRARRALVLALALGILFPGCGGGGSGSPAPVPPSPSVDPIPAFLPPPILMAFEGSHVTRYQPEVLNLEGPIGFTVAPPLPEGLSLDAATGVISGVPTGAAGRTVHALTASNGRATAKVDVTIEVLDADDHSPDYGSFGFAANRNAPAEPLVPQVSPGWAGATFSVEPPLPEGLRLDPATGAITGTPTGEPGHSFHDLRMAKGTMVVSKPLEVLVSPTATKPLTYPRHLEATRGMAIAELRPVEAWTGASFSVAPPLPEGLQLDPATGAISGTPQRAQWQTHVVTAACGADLATAVIRIEVNAPAWQDPVPPPLRFAYPVTALTATRWVPIEDLRPQVEDAPFATFSVAPPLPEGLHLNHRSGVITGKPTQVIPSSIHTVTLDSWTGTATTVLTITVQPAPPLQLRYPTAALVCTARVAIANLMPLGDGDWTKVTFSVSPDLPAGLHLGRHDGALTGTPTRKSGPVSYTITATRDGETATAGLDLTVHDPAPERLSYAHPRAVLPQGLPIPPNRPACAGGGTPTAYTIAPPLPAGLSLDPATGILDGTPTATASPAQYTVTASNVSGSASTILHLEVLPALATPALTAPTFATAETGVVSCSVPDHGPDATYHWTMEDSRGVTERIKLGPDVSIHRAPAGPLKVSVTVTCRRGAATAHTTVTIVPEPRAELHLPTNAHPGDPCFMARVPAQEGMTYQWVLEPGSSEAALAGSADSASIRITPGYREGRFQVRVTVTNQAGAHAAATREVQVGRGLWVAKEPPGSAEPTRARTSATLLDDGRLLVVGKSFLLPGRVPATRAAAAILTPVRGRWTRLGLEEGFLDHTATLLHDGSVLVVGERPSGPAVQRFDPASEAWLPAAPLGWPRQGHTATLLEDGRVLVAGGRKPGAPDNVHEAELYDPAHNVWLPAGSLLQARLAHTATLLDAGRVMVVGGLERPNTAEVFDAASGSWHPLPGPLGLRAGHTATRLPDGRVLLVGGLGAPSALYPEAFDPATGTWTPTERMGTGRVWHTATLLPTGKVLVAGGRKADASVGLRSSELFDPVTGRWAPTGSLQGVRFGHTATLLQDGTVLVTLGLEADRASERYEAPLEPAGHGSHEDAPPPDANLDAPVAADYALLELDPTSTHTLSAVKKAFRKQALLWHPDKHTGPARTTAEDKFKAINAAYEKIKTHLERP